MSVTAVPFPLTLCGMMGESGTECVCACVPVCDYDVSMCKLRLSRKSSFLGREGDSCAASDVERRLDRCGDLKDAGD